MSGQTPLFNIRLGGATLSDDGLYRYRLWRRLDDSTTTRTALFIMLNPSTADAATDDPTIRRCIGFARREGCNRLEVVNLYALRSTNPKNLIGHPDPIGPDNLDHILDAMNGAAITIAAWGAGWRKVHTAESWAVVMDAGRDELLCLGQTKNGDPRHPLYVRSDQPLEVYR